MSRADCLGGGELEMGSERLGHREIGLQEMEEPGEAGSEVAATEEGFDGGGGGGVERAEILAAIGLTASMRSGSALPGSAAIAPGHS